MVDDLVVAPVIPRPADPSANKPTYILRVEDPELKGKIRYFQVQKLDKLPTHLSICGFEIKKSQAEELLKSISKITANREVNIEFPWHKEISIQNATNKKKANGE